MKEEIIIYTLNDEIIDIEWCFIQGHTPPKDKKYRYKVDHVPYVTHHNEMTGAQILEAANKKPAEYILRQKFKGSWVTIEPKEVVDFTKHGIEKFKTIKNDHTEGESDQTEKSPRRDFSLLEEDEEYLNSLNLIWEAVLEGPAQWVLIHDYGIPTGYNADKVILAVRVAPHYPTVQLDMLYFNPALSRKDGTTIGALTEITLDGKTFQQWSRHRTAESAWRVGIDNFSTHVPLAEIWLSNEFIKKQTA